MNQDKQKLLKQASLLISTESLESLTLRKLADAAGMTTMAVYKYFGGKEGVLEGLRLEGFELLLEAQKAVLAKKLGPEETLVELCLSYRRIARTHPQHYRLMVDQPSQSATAYQTFELLRKASAMHRPDDPRLAQRLFALCHGIVSLEIAGLITVDEDFCRAQVQSLLAGLQVKGDARLGPAH